MLASQKHSREWLRGYPHLFSPLRDLQKENEERRLLLECNLEIIVRSLLN